MPTNYETDEEILATIRSAGVMCRGIERELRELIRYRRDMHKSGIATGTAKTALQAILTDIGDHKDDLVTKLGLMTTSAMPIVTPGAPPTLEYLAVAPDTYNYAYSWIIPSPSVRPATFEQTALYDVFSVNDIIELMDCADADNNHFKAKVIANLNLVNGGSFVALDNDDDYWSLNFGTVGDWGTSHWTISGDKALHATGNTSALVQYASSMKFPMLSGYYYTLGYTVSSRTAGSVTSQVGTTEVIGSQTVRSADGTYSETVYCPLGTAPYIAFVPGSTFDGKIDDVSLTPLDWIYVDGRVPVTTAEDRTMKILMRTEA